MIAVSVNSPGLVAGRPAQLDVRFSNRGAGPCRNLVFTLGTPSGSDLKFVAGGERIDVAVIEPGRDVVRSVPVAVARAGEYVLTSPNFSYRDEDDMPIRERNWRAVLTVAESAPHRDAVPVLRPAPRLLVDSQADGLAVNEWAQLPILVRNPGDVPVTDVFVSISGPVRTHGKRGRIPALDGGRTARIRFDVMPTNGGLVPLVIRLEYSYPDGAGSLRPASHEAPVHVPVAAPGSRTRPAVHEAGQGRPGRRRTVLFLAASPKDFPPIRQDQEFKRITRELQLSPNRDDFLLASEQAALLDDIHRALILHKPDIVHFSGHGDADGRLYVEDEMGAGKATNVEGVAEFFGVYKDHIRCVLVNACYSESLAKAVSRDIEYAIGMNSEVGDHASIVFSVAFYRSLFGGESVPDAFKAARRLVQADEATMLEYQTPVLYRGGLGG